MLMGVSDTAGNLGELAIRTPLLNPSYTFAVFAWS
jgi:hypothetical protein